MRLKLGHRLKNSALVLTQGAWRFWATVLILVVSLIAPAIWTCDAEAVFRHTGVGLQLAGFGTVAYGIRETRRRFRLPSMPKSFSTWVAKLKNAALIPPITAQGSVFLGELRATGSATVSMTPEVTPQTVEGRLTAVEEGQKDIRQRLARLASDSAQAATDFRAALAGELATRESADREIELLIEKQAAGGLHLEVMGLVWLLFGTAAGSLSGELASLLAGYPCL